MGTRANITAVAIAVAVTLSLAVAQAAPSPATIQAAARKSIRADAKAFLKTYAQESGHRPVRPSVRVTFGPASGTPAVAFAANATILERVAAGPRGRVPLARTRFQVAGAANASAVTVQRRMPWDLVD